jgi:amidase
MACLSQPGGADMSGSMTSPATGTELWQMSATELAAVIRRREVSAREVIEAHLRRIDAVNPALNAIVIRLDEQALAAADAADRAAGAGAGAPPLRGVPFTIKECFDLAGTPTTHGAKLWADAYPTQDAPDVARLKAAGAIPIGRTNLATLTVRWHCESELWGHTVNPWDAARTPGASSGGDAVAVAAGMAPLGLGGDGLGSLRWPAQCCGITALKPTFGRVPAAGEMTIGEQLVVVDGPMARRVADLRAAFEVMAGPTWRDPRTVPAPLSGLPLARPVRVAVVADPGGHGTARPVQAAVRTAAATLAGAGYLVEEAEPPGIDQAAQTALSMLNTPEWRAVLPLLSVFDAATRRFLGQFYDACGNPDPVATVESFKTRHTLARQWGQFQQTRPLIVAPICTGIPFKVGTDLAEGEVVQTIHSMRMAIAVNALGLPAVAVPVGAADGLPQVVQVIGPRYREDLCLDAAAALEEALGVLTPIDPR